MSLLLAHPVPFEGGVRLPPNKAQSLSKPLGQAAIPPVLIIPLRQHIGAAATPVVKTGDRVLKGQVIARQEGFIGAPVHASSSGTVIGIGEHPVPSPSGQADLCIVIETDGRDEWIDHAGLADDLFETSPVDIHDRILAAGIVGLGGAGFPSAVKMLPGLHFDIRLLILNAAECEPYITCDEALIREKADEIIEGLAIMRHAVQAGECVIGIEDNKSEAIEALERELEKQGETGIRLVKLPPIYPAGGEKQLVRSLTGLEVPSEGLPLELGIVCYNVGTIHAIYRTVSRGEPLISRIVTITGGAVREPRNLDVLIGTPMRELIEQCGGYADDVDRLLLGGPMMGFTLRDDSLPVTKTSNCIIAAAPGELPAPPPALPCIRCGDCVTVCPVSLLPQQLYWFARSDNHERLQEYKLFDCIECGCCAYVCPSHIPLVRYYQSAKSAIWERERRRLKAERSRQRFESRRERLGMEKLEEAAAKLPAEEEEKVDLRAEIEAAVKRVRAKRKRREAGDNGKESGDGD